MLVEVCVVIGIGATVVAGYYIYKTVCKMQKKIEKQQTDPDEPPPSTNAPPNNPPPPKKQSSMAGTQTSALSGASGAITDELSLIMKSIAMTNGWTTTDISGQSATNIALLDPVTTNTYTLWSRVAVFSSTNLASLPTTNNAGIWMKDVSKCAIRMRMWITCGGNNSQNQIWSQLTVVDGYLIVPFTNYWQCEYPSNYNYVDPTNIEGLVNQIVPAPHPLSDKARFFKLSPADTQ
jgi:hypothetical protein